MSRDLRWGGAVRYFVKRMAETVFTYYGFAVTTRNGHCCRCGRYPGVRQRLHILVDETKQELLEYGIDCWPLNMLPALQKAIQEERDEERQEGHAGQLCPILSLE